MKRISTTTIIAMLAFAAGTVTGWNVKAGGIQWRLSEAAGRGHVNEMKRLIAMGADPLVRPDDGYFLGSQPIYAAARAGEPEAVAFLVGIGADVNVIHATETPLDSAIHKRLEIERTIEILKRHGARTYAELRWTSSSR